MSGNATSDPSGGEPPPELSDEATPQACSRRGLLTSLFALSIAGAVSLDPEPAEARWGSFFGLPIYVPSYRGGGGGRRPKRRHVAGRSGRRGGKKGAKVASPGGGPDVPKFDY